MVDMLEDFVRPSGGLYCGPGAAAIVPVIREKIGEVLCEGGSVIFICDSHDPDDAEFARFPSHCVRNTPGAGIIAPLRDACGDRDGVFIVEKTRYSGFFGTELDVILRRLNPSVIEVVGVCTNICVLYTVEELCNRDYSVKVYRDGVASFDNDAAAWALNQMERVLGAQVV